MPEEHDHTNAPSQSDSMRIACPNGHRLKVPVRLAGTNGKCPKCEVVFKIPQPVRHNTDTRELTATQSLLTGLRSHKVLRNIAIRMYVGGAIMCFFGLFLFPNLSAKFAEKGDQEEVRKLFITQNVFTLIGGICVCSAGAISIYTVINRDSLTRNPSLNPMLRGMLALPENTLQDRQQSSTTRPHETDLSSSSTKLEALQNEKNVLLANRRKLGKGCIGFVVAGTA